MEHLRPIQCLLCMGPLLTLERKVYFVGPVFYVLFTTQHLSDGICGSL